MDRIEKITAYENGELSMVETVELFAELIRTQLAWNLQGCYGRQAAAFIRTGIISSDTGTINYDRLDEVLER